MLVARLFASRVGEVLPGNVVSVQPFGLVVQLIGTGATGTIALDGLPDGPYRVEYGTQTVVGPRTSFSVGDALTAKIAGTNEELGRIELLVAP
jgi:ribonuclease R